MTLPLLPYRLLQTPRPLQTPSVKSCILLHHRHTYLRTQAAVLECDCCITCLVLSSYCKYGYAVGICPFARWRYSYAGPSSLIRSSFNHITFDRAIVLTYNCYSYCITLLFLQGQFGWISLYRSCILTRRWCRSRRYRNCWCRRWR